MFGTYAASCKVLNPLHPHINMHILNTVFLYIFHGADKENLFNNQELLLLVIISFILVTLMVDLGRHSGEKIRF